MLKQKIPVAFLIIHNHADYTQKIPLFQGENVIGRVPEKSSVVIKDPQISSAHAKLKITNGKIKIIDIGSKNGTFMELDTKQKIRKLEEYDLDEGHRFGLGEIVCSVEKVSQPKKEPQKNQVVKGEASKKQNLLFELNESQQSSRVQEKPKGSKKNNSQMAGLEKKGPTIDKQKPRISPYIEGNSQSELSQSEELQVPTKIKEDIQRKEKEENQKKEKQKNEKIQKQKEEKQNKLRKEKELKEKKSKQQKEKEDLKNKQKQDIKKQQKQNATDKQKRDVKETKSKEVQEKSKEQQRDKDQSKNEKQNSKKAQNSQGALDEKKQTKNKKAGKKQTKPAQQESDQEQQKTSQKKEVEKKKVSRQKGKKDEEKSKPTKQDEKDNKENTKKTSKQQKGKKSLQKDKKKKTEKENDTDDENQSSGDDTKSKEKKGKRKTLEKAVNIRKDMDTTKNRKRQPEDRESVERVGYHTRKRLLRVTKFLVSGTTVTFHVNPLLESVKDEEEEYDVLVMEKFQRTYKLLVSIMKGIPVVKKSWLTDSEYRKKAAEFQHYWLPYPDNKSLIQKSVEKVQTGFKIFDGMYFYLVNEFDMHLEAGKIQRLIYLGGGEVLKTVTSYKNDRNFMKNVYAIVEKHEDKYKEEDLTKAKNINRDNVYSLELILEGCLTQELDLDQFKIDC